MILQVHHADVADATFGTNGTVITLVREEVEAVRVTITERGLSATHVVNGVHSNGFDGLAAFFAGLADDWRGWGGDRVYESLEHDFRLVAVHDGHVRLKVRLWRSSDPVIQKAGASRPE